MKQVILVREDLNMSAGKVAAQVAHGAMIFLLEAIRKSIQLRPVDIDYFFTDNEWEWMYSEKDMNEDWNYGGIKKIVLCVPDLDTLINYHDKAGSMGLKTHSVFDETLRCTTVLAIGPDDEDKIDSLTRGLPLYPRKT